MAISSLLLLLACRGAWTEDAAFAPARARLDADGDGRVVAGEYADFAVSAPAFATVDADGDGDLSNGELRALYRSQDPRDFLPAPPLPGGPPVQERLGGIVVDVGETLRQEILAVDPDAAVPSEAQLREADRLGGLDTPEAQALLRSLYVAAQAAGVPFPRSLKGSGLDP